MTRALELLQRLVVAIEKIAAEETQDTDVQENIGQLVCRNQDRLGILYARIRKTLVRTGVWELPADNLAHVEVQRTLLESKNFGDKSYKALAVIAKDNGINMNAF